MGIGQYEALTDRELTDRLNDRDMQAYDQIYNRYWRIIYNFAFRLVKEKQDAEDITQDIFSSLYRKMGNTDFCKIEIRRYLFSATRYSYIDHVRKSQHKDTYINSFRDYLHQVETETADVKIREHEMRKLIEQEVARLPEKMRKIFELSRNEYLNRSEIADQLDLSEETVKSQLARAVKLLRSRLGAFLFFHLMLAILYINRIL